MSTPFRKLLARFGVKQKAAHKADQIRTLTSQQNWIEFVESISAYSSTGVLSNNKALRVSAVFACNDRIAKDISSLPLRPMRKTANGYEIASDHDQYFIGRKPHPFFTKTVWQYVLNSHINLFGECFSPITRVNGRPTQYGLWIPTDVEHKIEDNILYWVNKKTKEVVNDEDMIHVMWFTEDGIRGKSPLHYQKETIDLALFGAKLSASLYENQMWSPGYIQYGADLTSEQADFISKNWSSFSGEAEKNVVRVLDNKSEWKHFGMSLKDSEYLGTMERTVREIARAMGVPGSKIGVREANVSYNSLEQENIAYVQDTILPRVIAWEEELERKSLSDADADKIRFKYEIKSRLRGDMAARSAFYDMALRNGLLSINDTLRLEDMDTIGPEGDERYVNAAQVPLSKLYSGEVNEKAPADAVKNLLKTINTNGNGTAKVYS